MPLQTVDQRQPPSSAASRPHHPPEPENFPCPRCDSTNTKFCYYNNYNLSQPRYFCKSCRRYWTRGGTLRNVPFGGGTRKNPLKRSRPSVPAAASSSSSSSAITLVPPPATFYSDINTDGGNSNYQYDPVPTIPATFTSLLADTHEGSGGLFGYGGGGGIREMEFGLSIGVWPMEEISGGDSGVAWEMGATGGERGLTLDSDCLDWPELAISTPGKLMK